MFAFDKPIVWIIILVIVIVLFGANRLTDVGKSLGRGIREFKEETQMDKDKKSPASTTTTLNTTPIASANGVGDDEEVVVTRRERKREDGSVEVVEERVVRKRSQV